MMTSESQATPERQIVLKALELRREYIRKLQIAERQVELGTYRGIWIDYRALIVGMERDPKFLAAMERHGLTWDSIE